LISEDKMLKRSLLFICLLSITISTGFAEDPNYIPDYIITTDDGQGADTYLNYWNLNGNYGTGDSLKLSKNYIPYLKFDLSAAGIDRITTASLSLYGYGPQDEPGYAVFDETFTIYGLIDGSDGWGETSINYGNAPLVSNPIQQHPYLVELGTVEFDKDDPNALFTMVNTGTAFVDFLNNRGPDLLVSIIIASDLSTPGEYFLTKEMSPAGSKAPYLEITTDPSTTPGNSWTGSTSDNWNISDNWINESLIPDIPDSNDLVILTTGSNYPVVVDENSFAKKLFIDTGGLNLVDGTLSLSSTILRIKDGVAIDFDGGQLTMAGDAEELIPIYFDDDKIICNPGKEVYAEYIVPSDTTIVTLQKEVPVLTWGLEIIDANAPSVGFQGDIGAPAYQCVDASGITGNVHAGFTSLNSWYGKKLGPGAEPETIITFDKAYELTEMWVWNYENAWNGYGLKQVKVEYSANGVDYTTLMNGALEEFTFSLGNYDGTKSDVIDFGNVQAKVVKLTAVGGPGVGNHETTNYGSYILRELRFYHYDPKARRPDPADGAEVDVDYDLSWTPGVGAVTGQDVWLGKAGDTMVKVGDNIADDAYELDIAVLDDNEDYVWRVDGLDSGGSTTTGDLWSFTTRGRLSYPDGGIITATESHAAWNVPITYGANRVVDGSGMTANTHGGEVAGTYWYARMVGLDPLTEPWAMFTFDDTYYLDEMWVWNCDESINESGRALKRVKIEYSLLDDPDVGNPADWTILMDGANPYFEWTKSVDGQVSDMIDFDNVIARHVKITPIGGIGIGNYGSAYGYLLNELRLYHNGIWINPQARVPSPLDEAEVDIFTELGWSPGGGAVTGQDVWFGLTSGSLEKIADNIGPTVNSLALPILENLEDYTWRVDGLDGATPTTGVEWTFSTRARLRWNPGLIGVIAGTGSPGSGGTDGDRAVNETGINGDLHDGFQWSNGWYCRRPQDVGITEPDLVVEFDRPYEITDMWLWNHDGTTTGPDGEAPIAVKKIKVEYSTDGVNYDILMNGGSTVFDNLPHGNLDGTHDTVINFGGVTAKFVRITLLENYGSVWGFKLREVRFYYNVPLWSDIDYNKKVNLADFAILAFDWLADNWITDPIVYCLDRPLGDVDGDCDVDLDDISFMATEWLDDIN